MIPAVPGGITSGSSCGNVLSLRDSVIPDKKKEAPAALEAPATLAPAAPEAPAALAAPAAPAALAALAAPAPPAKFRKQCIFSKKTNVCIY